MKTVRGTGLVCAALILLQGAPLFAQPGGSKAMPVETAEMTEKARELYESGSSALQKGRWGEAHASLLAAWSLKKHHQIAGNLAAAEMRLRRYREAAEHLAFYLREAPATKQKERQSAQALLADARKHIGSLAIKVEPVGAEVLVDGVPVGVSPLAGEVFVEPGAHVIEAKLDGYEVAKVTVEMTPGSSREMPLRLVKSEVTPKSAGGSGAGSGGKASVVMDTKNAEQGPNKMMIIGGIAASVVGLGMGMGFAVASNVNANDAAEQRTSLRQKGGIDPCKMPSLANECSDHQNTVERRDAFANAALWSFLVSGAVGAGTVIYAVVASKPSPHVKVLPTVTGTSGGIVVASDW